MTLSQTFAARFVPLALLIALHAAPAQAQLLDILKRLPFPLGASAPGQGAAPADALASAGPVQPIKAGQQIESEMAPDTQCKRPRERFNVGEKLAEYGGIAAGLRLQRLIASDFTHAELKPEDLQMLRYLAKTTVWLPAEAEAKLGSIYDGATSMFGLLKSVGDLDRLAMDDIEARLAKLRGTVTEYPADIRLSLDKTLADGAYARFGGVIQLSSRFLNGLVDAGAGADFLLAHEVSHIYKRHAMKDLQFKLISSSEGWELGKKVLQRAQRGMEIDPIGDGVFLFTTIPRLMNFIRSVQLSFGRDQELEADACSTVWLKAVQTDPFEAWDQYHAKLGVSTSYAVEHPTHEEREARFRRRAAAAPAKAEATPVGVGTVKSGGQKIVTEAGKKKP